MKTKRILVAILIATMCIFVACNKASDNTKETEETQITTEAVTEVSEETEVPTATPKPTKAPTATPTVAPTPTCAIPINERVDSMREDLRSIHEAHPSDPLFMEIHANADTNYLSCRIYASSGATYETDSDVIGFVDELIYIEADVYTYDWVMRHSNQEIINGSLVDGLDVLPDGHYAGLTRSITQDGTMMEVIVGEVIGTGSSDYPIVCNPVILWVPISSTAEFYDGISFFYYVEPGSEYFYDHITVSPFWRLVTGNYAENEVHYEYPGVTPYTHSVYGPCYGFHLDGQRSAAEQRSYGYSYDAGVAVSIDVTDGTVTRMSMSAS